MALADITNQVAPQPPAAAKSVSRKKKKTSPKKKVPKKAKKQSRKPPNQHSEPPKSCWIHDYVHGVTPLPEPFATTPDAQNRYYCLFCQVHVPECSTQTHRNRNDHTHGRKHMAHVQILRNLQPSHVNDYMAIRSQKVHVLEAYLAKSSLASEDKQHHHNEQVVRDALQSITDASLRATRTDEFERLLPQFHQHKGLDSNLEWFAKYVVASCSDSTLSTGKGTLWQQFQAWKSQQAQQQAAAADDSSIETVDSNVTGLSKLYEVCLGHPHAAQAQKRLEYLYQNDRPAFFRRLNEFLPLFQRIRDQAPSHKRRAHWEALSQYLEEPTHVRLSHFGQGSLWNQFHVWKQAQPTPQVATPQKLTSVRLSPSSSFASEAWKIHMDPTSGLWSVASPSVASDSPRSMATSVRVEDSSCEIIVDEVVLEAQSEAVECSPDARVEPAAASHVTDSEATRKRSEEAPEPHSIEFKEEEYLELEDPDVELEIEQQPVFEQESIHKVSPLTTATVIDFDEVVIIPPIEENDAKDDRAHACLQALAFLGAF